jgi:hypothetical protein
MLDTINRIAAVTAMVALFTACGGESGTTVNKRAPEILEFFVHPSTVEAGEYVQVGWVTQYANRVALFERTTVDGAQVDTQLYETVETLSGFFHYRTHRSLELVVKAYNTNSGSGPVESVITVTTLSEAPDHIYSFWPDPILVEPGDPIALKYTVVDVLPGWKLRVGQVDDAGAGTLEHTFGEGGSQIDGLFSVADCSSTSLLCIDGHTGYYAMLLDETGAELEYRESSAGLIAVDPPQIVAFTIADETIIIGSSTTVSWDVRNADRVVVGPGLSDQWCVDMVCAGSGSVTPTFSQSFELTAYGPGGTMVATRSITVLTAPIPPTVESFTANPAQMRPGFSATLTWDTTLADSVDITAVPADATLTGTFSTDGTTSVSPTATTVYTITATSTHGTDVDTATVTVTPLIAGDLVISEIMADATTDPAGEWFEIYNDSALDTNLYGLTFTSAGSETMTVGSDVIVAPGGYALLAASSTPADNDNLPTADYYYTGLTFDEGTDDSLSVSDGGTPIDTVVWDATWSMSTDYSLSLTSLDATDNDTSTNWCAAGNHWTGAVSSYGSPGYAHDACD